MPRWAFVACLGFIGLLASTIFAMGIYFNVLHDTTNTASALSNDYISLSMQQSIIKTQVSANVSIINQLINVIHNLAAKQETNEENIAGIQATLNQINERLANLLQRKY